MPEPLRSSRSQEATVLLQRYATVRNDAEKRSVVDMLNTVFPAIRFRHHYSNDRGLSFEGLVAYFMSSRVRVPPRSVMFAVNVLIRVEDNGRATLVKNRVGNLDAVWQANDLLADLGGVVERKSRWTLLQEEDWL